MNEENLRYAFSVLRTTEDFQTADALKTVVERLNQWIKLDHPAEDWHADPLIDTLPEELQKLPAVQNLGELKFPLSDGPDLQLVVWLNEIAKRARGADSQPVAIAQALFDWIIRNIQIERDNVATVPYQPRDMLILGRGTAVDRAWLFALLARQQGLDVVMLGLPGADSSDRAAPVAAGAVCRWRVLSCSTRGWVCPSLGPTASRSQRSTTCWPTRNCCAAWMSTSSGIYPVKAADLEHVTVLVEGSPMYLSRRMQLVGRNLPGKESLVLSTQPSRLAERAKSHPAHRNSPIMAAALPAAAGHVAAGSRDPAKGDARLRPVSISEACPVAGAGVALAGNVRWREGGQRAVSVLRPSDADLKAYRANAPAKERERAEADLVQVQAAKQSASYWLGIVAFERGNYGAAVDYLKTRTLEASPDGPWTAGARYNLGAPTKRSARPTTRSATTGPICPRSATETCCALGGWKSPASRPRPPSRRPIRSRGGDLARRAKHG